MAETKKAFLEKEGLLNPKPERVRHPLFQTLAFCDPLDLPQVRYEMLRAARAKTASVAEACRLFGFSREYFYKLERAFQSRGYAALLGSPPWGAARSSLSTPSSSTSSSSESSTNPGSVPRRCAKRSNVCTSSSARAEPSSGSWRRSGWEKKSGAHPDPQGSLRRMPTPAVLPP